MILKRPQHLIPLSHAFLCVLCVSVVQFGAVTVIEGIHHRDAEHTEKTLFNRRTRRNVKDPKDSMLPSPLRSFAIFLPTGRRQAHGHPILHFPSVVGPALSPAGSQRQLSDAQMHAINWTIDKLVCNGIRGYRTEHPGSARQEPVLVALGREDKQSNRPTRRTA